MLSAVFEYLIFNAQDLPFSAHYTAAEITLRNPCPDGRGWPAPADRVRGGVPHPPHHLNAKSRRSWPIGGFDRWPVPRIQFRPGFQSP